MLNLTRFGRAENVHDGPSPSAIGRTYLRSRPGCAQCETDPNDSIT